jgi:2-oxoisovalerate dehydrogenase E1 component
VTEKCFKYLDGPIIRVGGLDTPIPFRRELEENYMPGGRIENKIQILLNY